MERSTKDVCANSDVRLHNTSSSDTSTSGSEYESSTSNCSSEKGRKDSVSRKRLRSSHEKNLRVYKRKSRVTHRSRPYTSSIKHSSSKDCRISPISGLHSARVSNRSRKGIDEDEEDHHMQSEGKTDAEKKRRHLSKCSPIRHKLSPPSVGRFERPYNEKESYDSWNSKALPRTGASSNHDNDGAKWSYSTVERLERQRKDVAVLNVSNTYSASSEECAALASGLYSVHGGKDEQRIVTSRSTNDDCKRHDWYINHHTSMESPPNVQRTVRDYIYNASRNSSQKLSQPTIIEQYRLGDEPKYWFKNQEQEKSMELKAEQRKKITRSYDMKKFSSGKCSPAHSMHSYFPQNYQMQPISNDRCSLNYALVPPPLMTLPVHSPAGPNGTLLAKYIPNAGTTSIPAKLNSTLPQQFRCNDDYRLAPAAAEKPSISTKEVKTSMEGMSSCATVPNPLSGTSNLQATINVPKNSNKEYASDDMLLLAINSNRADDLSEISDSDDGILNKAEKSKDEHGSHVSETAYVKDPFYNCPAIDGDFEEISDCELEEDNYHRSGIHGALVVNWQGLISEARKHQKQCLTHRISKAHKDQKCFRSYRIFRAVGLSEHMCRNDFYRNATRRLHDNLLQQSEGSNFPEKHDLLSDLLDSKFDASAAFVQVGTQERHQQATSLITNIIESLSARHDLKLRRKVCDLPIKENSIPISQPLAVNQLKQYYENVLGTLWH